MSELGDKRRLFTRMLGELIRWASENGYELSIGEVYRTPEQAALNAAKGIGIRHSLHTYGLAVDLNLYIGGVYQTDSAAYRPLGEYWESLHAGARWGGRFRKPDGNHFSITHAGLAVLQGDDVARA